MQTTLEANQMDLRIKKINSFKKEAFLYGNRGKIACIVSSFIFGLVASSLFVVLGVILNSGLPLVNISTVIMSGTILLAVLIPLASEVRFNFIYLEPTCAEMAEYYKFKFEELAEKQKKTRKRI